MAHAENADQLTKLYVEITTSCNLDCQMCLRRAWNEPLGRMPMAVFANLMRQVSRFPAPPTIHLGGYGEPTTHPDFLEMVRLAKAAGARVEATTNGTLLDADMSTALIEAEMDRLVVSVDGVTPESYEDIRVYGSFKQVIENLKTLQRLKIRYRGRHSRPEVGLAFVAMKRNVQELAELPRLAIRVGAQTIQVSNVVPHSPEMEEEILYHDSLTACAFRPSPWVANLSLPKLDLNDRTMPTVAQVFNSTASISLLDASLNGRDNYCRFAQQGYSVIRWDGEVSPCLSMLHTYPMYLHNRRKLISHYSLGNINHSDLLAIWQSQEYADFRARLRKFSFSPCTTCGGCEWFSANQMDCSHNDFPVCGGCLWAQGFVQCP